MQSARAAAPTRHDAATPMPNTARRIYFASPPPLLDSLASSGRRPKWLFFGKPLGASRPASARLPRQSESSFIDIVKVRPAPSIQVRPSPDLNVVTSDSEPSL